MLKHRNEACPDTIIPYYRTTLLKHPLDNSARKFKYYKVSPHERVCREPRYIMFHHFSQMMSGVTKDDNNLHKHEK